MPTLYRDTGYSLTHLIEDIRHGRIALPDIQRPFVWSSSKTRDLFDSMYRGYPIGTLMFWETGAEAGIRKIGGGDLDRVPSLLVVDGQQRLTSLYAVLTGERVLTKSFESKQIRIAFRPENEAFEVMDAAIERDPEFIPDITTLWNSQYRSTVRSFISRLGEARGTELDEGEQDLIEERIDRVRDLREFRFLAVELGAATNEEQVAEIFVRINSEGVKLNQADFILTLMSVHWEKGRRQLEAFSRSATDPAAPTPNAKNSFLEPSPDQLLRVAVALAFRRGRLQHVYSLLRGKDLETGEVSTERRNQQFDVLAEAQEQVLDLQNWHEFLKCLRLAGFRSRRMLTSESAVLFSYAMWLIARVDFGLDFATLRPVIARWFFMVHTTARYSASSESQLESDLSRISALPQGNGVALLGELDRIVAAHFTRDYWGITLPNALDTAASRSPALFAYLAALNLLEAEALFSNVPVADLLDPELAPPRAIERHHLFPKANLGKLGVTNTKQVNAVANMAFLDWAENASISDRAPSEYLPVMVAGMDPERLRRQVKLHALPIGWEQLDYPTFLERRRSLMAEVVEQGFSTLRTTNHVATEATIEDQIAVGESQMLEFKSSARWNIHTRTADPKLEHVIVKTVCGFLNAEGGVLLIGVNDAGEAIGLEGDLSTLGSKMNLDGYELFLRQLLESNIAATTAATVKIGFPQAAGTTICSITVAPSGRPVFAKPPRSAGTPGEEFWIRLGNQTRQLYGDEFLQYRDEHWG